MESLFPTLPSQLFSKTSLVGLSLSGDLWARAVHVRGRPGAQSEPGRTAAGEERRGTASLVGVKWRPWRWSCPSSPVPLHPALAPGGVGFWPFALFMAAALSITAFPVMARILKDRGMTRTPVRQQALSAAAAMVDIVRMDPARAGRSRSSAPATDTSDCSRPASAWSSWSLSRCASPEAGVRLAAAHWRRRRMPASDDGAG